MKSFKYTLFVLFFFSLHFGKVYSQVDGGSLLSLVKATTSEINAISPTPGKGTLIYNTDDDKVYAFNGTDWVVVTSKFVDGTNTNDAVYSSGNVGIGTSTPSTKLEVANGAIKATGGLIIETRTDDPASPEDGRLWLRTDL